MSVRWRDLLLACAALAALGVMAPGGGAAGQPEKAPPEKAPPEKAPPEKAPPEKGGAPGAEKLPKCVGVRSEARFSGYGYDHVVEVDNRCDKSASCTVATDVNPQAQAITVNAGEKRSVMTFRGSPASAFKPDVACKLAS